MCMFYKLQPPSSHVPTIVQLSIGFTVQDLVSCLLIYYTGGTAPLIRKSTHKGTRLGQNPLTLYINKYTYIPKVL